MQMYKVFIQNKPLFFINSKKINEFEGLFIRESLAISNKRYVLYLLQESSKNIPIFILCENIDNALYSFFEDYDFVEAAGGIVKRKDKYLFIKRNGVWDIPKGKIEENENPSIAAVREIHEECGILCATIEKPLIITYHTYQFKGVDTIKKTYWYGLNYDGKKTVKAQKEEGITKVKWVDLDRVKIIRTITFPSLVDVIDSYFGKE
jgi:8-oxo-dGTP pyrophosphatase MutT (NUDIX family)